MSSYNPTSITNTTDVDQVYLDYLNQPVMISPGETKVVNLQSYSESGSGSSWISTSGIPSGVLGNVGDWAFDPTTGTIYLKTGVSTWTVQVTLPLSTVAQSQVLLTNEAGHIYKLWLPGTTDDTTSSKFDRIA